jgi:hypothetical protein
VSADLLRRAAAELHDGPVLIDRQFQDAVADLLRDAAHSVDCRRLAERQVGVRDGATKTQSEDFAVAVALAVLAEGSPPPAEQADLPHGLDPGQVC